MRQLSEGMAFIREEVEVETDRLQRETQIAEENAKITEVLKEKIATARQAGKKKEKKCVLLLPHSLLLPYYSSYAH